MIRIAAMGAWSVRYYESTAVRGDEHGGGLSEYYSERDTRAPVMLVAGDRDFAEETMGVRHGEGISQEDVTRWFEEGVSPAGAGTDIPRPGTCGWDVLVTVPKSVSLQAALSKDPEVSSVVVKAVTDATEDALAGYLYRHAGYTRVSNAVDPRKKDLQRLPALPFVAYVHHTARPVADGTCDPHMHIHCLLPGKVARADGRMVTIDSQSMYHEAKAAGMVFQKSMRDRLSAALGIEWGPVDPYTGIAEIRGYQPETIGAWSRRSSAVLAWANEHLGEYSRLHTDDEHTDVTRPGWVKGEREWLDVAQKATRHQKLESLHYDELRARWRNDPRAADIDTDAFLDATTTVAGEKDGAGRPPEVADVLELLGTVKNSWTRADIVETVTGLWQPGHGLEVVSVDDIEAVVDDVIAQWCFQLVEDPKPWHREGHLRFTDAVTLTREAEVLELCGVKARGFGITVRDDWFIAQGLQPTAASAMGALSRSQRFINVLEAPAGTGKTTSLRAFRERAEGQRRRVVLLSTARKAINEARAADAASEFSTIAAARNRINQQRLDWDANTVVVVDEAGMAGDRDLHAVFKAAADAHAKVILVGDSRQLQPVQASGGLFRDLSEQLPWTQAFDYVWRQKDPEEKAATLAMRDAQTSTEINKVADWYTRHDRLRAGDAISINEQVVRDYFDEMVEGRDVLVLADKWEQADALNLRIQRITNIAWENQLGHQLDSVAISRDQHARYGDIVMTRNNNYDIEVTPDSKVTSIDQTPPKVANQDRWHVLSVDEDDGSIDAQRIGDNARATLPADYAQKDVVLGYVGTIHSAQGANAQVGFGISSPETMTRSMAYTAMTRGSENNRLYMGVAIAGEDEHHGREAEIEAEPREYSASEIKGMFADILKRDDRELTALAQAEQALEALAHGEPHAEHQTEFGGIDPFVAQLVHTRAGRRQQWAREESTATQEQHDSERASQRAQQRILDRIASRELDRAHSIDDRDDGREIG